MASLSPSTARKNDQHQEINKVQSASAVMSYANQCEP
jgi:hypothetical protein